MSFVLFFRFVLGSVAAGPVAVVGAVATVDSVGPVGPVGGGFSFFLALTAPKPHRGPQDPPWCHLGACGARYRGVCVRVTAINGPKPDFNG